MNMGEVEQTNSPYDINCPRCGAKRNPDLNQPCPLCKSRKYPVIGYTYGIEAKHILLLLLILAIILLIFLAIGAVYVLIKYLGIQVGSIIQFAYL